MPTLKKTNHRCPMCGGKKFEFGYETLAIWKIDTKGGANLLDPARGRIIAFVECMDCKLPTIKECIRGFLS